MRKYIKEKWVKALRSKEYKQGRCFLRSKDDEFCCLGVLCDLRKNSKFEWKNHGSHHHYSHMNNYNYGVLDDKIMKWARLKDNDASKLMNMNDTEERSFKYIANWIEKNL